MDRSTGEKMVVAAMKIIQEKAEIAELWGSYGNQVKLLQAMMEMKACMNIVQDIMDKGFFEDEEEHNKRESEGTG